MTLGRTRAKADTSQPRGCSAGIPCVRARPGVRRPTLFNSVALAGFVTYCFGLPVALLEALA